MKQHAFAISLILAVAASVASASSTLWSVAPPAGWKDVSASFVGHPEIQQASKQLAGLGGSLEFARYESATGDNLLVVFVRMSPAGKTPNADAAVPTYEAGIHRTEPDGSYRTHVEADALVADVTGTVPSGPVHIRRLTGMNATELISVSATCQGSAADCDPALQSLAIDRTGFQRLSALAAGGSRSRAYRAGGIAGCVALVVLIGWYLLRRKSQSARNAPPQ
jgi:hypothetical protein